MSVYLDCNATTPIDPAVQTLVCQFMAEEFGNSGSRTHEYGSRAKVAVQKARDQVAKGLGAEREEVVFTSGATESNNLAILGLSAFAEKAGRRHVISSRLEHKAVLEPLEQLQHNGFEVTMIEPEPGGYVDPDRIARALRPDTVLVTMMHVNNETGVIQPIAEICRQLQNHSAYFHVDAAQGFGKENDELRNPRIDLISVTAHKICGPKGVGALIAKRRGYERPPLTPLMFGGGQERGLRPGTLPVPLIAGFGLAAELAEKNAVARKKRCAAFRSAVLLGISHLRPEFNGDPDRVLPTTLNFSIAGLDSEAFMLATKGLIAVSNGSACTSQSYQPSHVLQAMGLPNDRIKGAIRMSWCHLTPDVNWSEVIAAVRLVH